MNIDNMKVAIRPMSTTQAIDLGMMMARHWFVPLWKIWIGMALPIFIIFNLSLVVLGIINDSSIGIWGGLIFWWLKPVYEKPMLAWLGQALFVEEPEVKQSIKQGWSSAKDHVGKLLFRYRLSTQRQLAIPIMMLEKPDNSQLKHRLSILSRGQGGVLGWHTFVMVNIEGMLGIAALILLYQLIPTEFMHVETLLQYLEYAPMWLNILWAVFFFLAASIIAPFFIAGGFAVYLTKRCLLEGWDVELVFKQLRQRYERTQSNPLTMLKNSQKTPLSMSSIRSQNHVSNPLDRKLAEKSGRSVSGANNVITSHIKHHASSRMGDGINGQGDK